MDRRSGRQGSDKVMEEGGGQGGAHSGSDGGNMHGFETTLTPNPGKHMGVTM